jgi:hypothetical protein
MFGDRIEGREALLVSDFGAKIVGKIPKLEVAIP